MLSIIYQAKEVAIPPSPKRDGVLAQELMIINRPALVLNRNWQPVNVAAVSRVLTMLCNETALVVDPVTFQTYDWSDWAKLQPKDGEDFIQAVKFKLRVPEIVTLTGYDELPVAAVTFSRRNIHKRDHYTCQYCSRQPGQGELTIDHVVPRAQGGESRWDNCVLACITCNKRKADRTPEQAGMKLKRLPVQPKWNPLYAAHDLRIKSWSKFVSEAYWTVPLTT